LKKNCIERAFWYREVIAETRPRFPGSRESHESWQPREKKTAAVWRCTDVKKQNGAEVEDIYL